MSDDNDVPFAEECKHSLQCQGRIAAGIALWSGQVPGRGSAYGGTSDMRASVCATLSVDSSPNSKKVAAIAPVAVVGVLIEAGIGASNSYSADTPGDWQASVILYRCRSCETLNCPDHGIWCD